MEKFYLNGTDIVTVQNAFGALPVQRRSKEDGVKILRSALERGMTYFDTARAYTDSEEKIGLAFEGVDRKKYYLATKTAATTPEGIRADLETSLKNLKTSYVDVYQLHNAQRCYSPNDGTGVYECMEELKKEGKIRFISITCHKIHVAEEAVRSGLYATLQYPFSYLADQREIDLVKLCAERGVGFIAMKGLAGGLINDSKAAFAYINQYKNVLPIWGIQKMEELDEWISYLDNPPKMSEEISKTVAEDREMLSGSFCRSCGYCMPCPKGIIINQCARTSLLLRRAPSERWLAPDWQGEMKKIEECLNCGACASKCPYGLDTPKLLRENYEDYFAVVRGEKKV